MNETLPAPPIPPGLSLRHLPYLPLKIKELQNSALMRKASGDAFRAAVALWMAAWWETPVASLPNDEGELMGIAGYRGGDAAWQAIRADAMRGFVLCSDGRLYHGTLVTAALEAAIKAKKKGSQTEAAREALAAKRRGDRPKVADPLLQTQLQTTGLSVTDENGDSNNDCNRPEEEQERELNKPIPSSGNRLPREATVTATVTDRPPGRPSDPLRPSLPADDRLLHDLMKAAGDKIGSTPALFITGPISSLIDSGEVTLLDDVLPVIREKASRETIPRGTVNSWKFYVADIRAHAAKRKAQDATIGAGKTLSVEEIMGGSK